VMRQKLISAFVSLTILAAPSVGAAQWSAVVSSSPAQAPSPNPLFPERLGIPWFGVPQLPHPQPSGMQNGSLSPSITATNREPFSLPISLSPTLHSEIVYVGNVPVRLLPLPLPPNPIVARLQSFGFLLQVPMIRSPVENPGNR